MNGPFQGSRLSNLREKRTSQLQNGNLAKQQQKPLTLQLQQQTAYQPSINVQAGRTATRFLIKGRIDKKDSSQGTNPPATNQVFVNKESTNFVPKPSLKLSEPSDTGDLKLVLNDSPQFDKKKVDVKVIAQQQPQKRILIQKKEQKEQPKPEIKSVVKEEVKPVKNLVNKIEEQPIAVKSNTDNKIEQAEVQQSKDDLQNENELVECPEGCGRKFNRKALEKHAKACKLVFMSKRKEFNSEAKRLTSQQQAALIKKNKLQEKKAQMGMTKGKGFQKTGQNWKSASEDFRSALKAIKKQGGEKQGEQQKEEMKMAACQYCQKQFAEVLLGKHLENCVKKKEKQLKEKKKTTKKK